MRRHPSRLASVLTATVLATTLFMPAGVSAADPPVPGDITINGGSLATNAASVTVSTPATNAVSMRLSNDGISYKSMAWAASTPWDLTDPAYGGTTAIESKWVYVEFDDGTDTWDPAWAAAPVHIYFDDQGPTESLMRVSFEPGRTVSGGKITQRVTWLNDDHQQSGTHSYDIEQRTDGGAWTALSAHPALPGLFLAFLPGHTYQLRVKGIDYAGNVSPDWYEGPPFRISAYQESSSKFTWKGSWTRPTRTSYWGTRAKSSATIGAKARFTFTGRSVALVSRLGTTRGALAVYVNGTRVDTVTLRASSTAYRRVVWTKTWATSASRTVTFKILSVPGADRAEIDAIVVGT